MINQLRSVNHNRLLVTLMVEAITIETCMGKGKYENKNNSMVHHFPVVIIKLVESEELLEFDTSVSILSFVICKYQ